MNLFFTTRFHWSNLVTRGSSNKLPRAQVSVNHELRGFSHGIYLAFSFQGCEGTAPLLSEGNQLVWPLGAPGVVSLQGGSCCAPAPQLICRGVCRDPSRSARWPHLVSALSRGGLWEVLRSGSSPSSGFLYFMCMSMFWAFSPHVSWSFTEVAWWWYLCSGFSECV